VSKQLARRILVALCAVAAGPASATNWYVDPAGPLTSIQQAVNGARAGDLIIVRPGTYHERIVLRDSISIAGERPGTVTVDAEGEGSVVTAIGVGPLTYLSDLTLRNGSAEQGGALFAIAAGPQLFDCTFESNTAVLGGGVYMRDASYANFYRCVFAGNTAQVGGGFFLDFSGGTVSDAYIHSNTAFDGSAVAASNGATIHFVESSVYANTAQPGGATLAINYSSPQFTRCTVASNVGGLGTFGTRSAGARVDHCIIGFNSATAFDCDGTNSLWVDCNVIYRNNGDEICSGDQGNNLWEDPLFCNANHLDFGLAANSPAAIGPCGPVGARPVSCPAQGVETATTRLDWGQVKQLYGR
jgi:hypothetical protein